jgi:DNA-binding GntR family transcriptional regulator
MATLSTSAPPDPADSSLVARALTSIRTRIVSGEYPPGSWLRLNMLTNETGASLIPVREALRLLEAERLVESIPNRGARVVGLSVDDLHDLYAVRTVLEAEAVRTSAPLDDEARRDLLEILAVMQRAVAAADTDEILRLNREFHFAIYRRCRSPWLLYLIEMLWQHNERYQRLSLEFRHDAADAEHRAIVDALAADDRDTAAKALAQHLSTTVTGLVERWSQPDDRDGSP